MSYRRSKATTERIRRQIEAMRRGKERAAMARATRDYPPPLPLLRRVVGQLDGRVMAPAPKRANGGPLLRVVPCSLREAQRFVARLHRHHKDQPLPGHKMSLGVEACTRLADGEAWALVGVAMIGNPSAPALQKDPRLVEIRRVCTDGTPNACSMLYGAARRALRAMGYETIITYTLPEEGGASLRAAGFVLDKADAGGASADWHNRAGRRALPIGTDLVGGKWRWLG